ncbi:hypothetical protein IQ06DRAFT_374056 [Phaeosphaeriaceae sp. SRC1lsM3a]|nr:hypothetical protein IQ06DRAFT_374056 [Stagonospora sp. SRC1lsM3a]
MASSWGNLLARQTSPMPPALTPEEIAYTNAPQILGITGSFFTLAAIVVLLRCYVRLRLLKTFGADDYVMLLAMVLNTATFVCFKLRTDYGLGRHLLVLFMNPSNVFKFQKTLYVQSLIMMVGISTVKISIALTLLRLSSERMHTRILWSTIVFLIFMTLGCGGSLVWQCLPVAAAWDYSLRPPPLGTGSAKCYSNIVFRNLGLMNSIFNIVTDVLFACLPVPLIWRLQLNLRTRLSLIAILSLGWFACCAAIVKTVYQWRIFEDTDWSVYDSFNVWGFVEFSIGIIAACLPTLKPLFRGLLDTARAITSGTRSRTGKYRTKGTQGYSKTADGWSQGIDMDSMNKHGSRSAHKSANDAYEVNVSTRPTGLADKAAWEAHRNNSDESINPLRPSEGPSSSGIVRTREVSIHH